MARGELRASDADREQVAERLRHATAEGRLAAHELEQRLGVALRARTYGELDGLIADLPGKQVTSPGRDARSLVRSHPVTAAALALATITVAVAAIAVLAFAGAAWIGWMVFAWFCFGRRHHYRGHHHRRGRGSGDRRPDPQTRWVQTSRSAVGGFSPRL